MSSFNKKLIVQVVSFWVVVICLSLFSVNCSMDEDIESQFYSSEDDNSDTSDDEGSDSEGDNEDGSDTEDGNDTEVSDFAWTEVTWLRDQNVSEWEESSEITSVEVRSDGSICIDHTERGQWPSQNVEDVTVDGNPWIIVKLDGQYYASTYEWLRPGQLCKLEHTGSIAALYDSEDSLGSHIKISPLSQWVPQGGEVVGFMVSGLARHQSTVPNVRKRTNIQWYRLPSADGLIEGEMLHATSNSSFSTTTTSTMASGSHFSQRSDNPPNMLNIVQEVANGNEQVLKDSCREGHENLNFLDLVLVELRKENEGTRWGFNCKRGNCDQLSIDAIAYYRGIGDPENSSDVAIFDIIASCHSDSPQAAWLDVTEATEDAGAIGRYKYPR